MSQLPKWVRACSIVMFALAAGCSSGQTGALTGIVTYQGKPLAMGSVVLDAGDGIPRTADVNADGTYSFNQVPTGSVRLAVLSPHPHSMGEKPKKGQPIPPTLDPSKWVKLPTEAGDVSTSGLSAEVRPGPNTFNIELK